MFQKNEFEWLRGGGEMGDLIRSMDWTKTSLGAVSTWPQSLKTAVTLCLSSTFPINIVWGPDHVQIYNDAYRPICGALHPASMGSKFKECWASALPVVGGAFDRGFQGEGTYIPNQRMFLERYGYLEEAFMTFSFSPIHDETGNVGGIFHPISESTERMLSSRRTQVLRDLGIEIQKAKSLDEIFECVISEAPKFELDLPFVSFFDKTNSKSSLDSSHPFSQRVSWNLDSISELTVVKDLRAKFPQAHVGPYDLGPDAAVVLPIFTPGSSSPLFYTVAGVSAGRELDSDYLSFFELIRNTITTAVSNVLAYEEEQKRAKALAEIDRAKTAFFSNVSHEFRTPLTLILGPLEDSLKDENHPLTAPQRERQEVIHRNSMRLLKLVNSLLDFARIESGRIQAKFEATPIANFTADLASVFRSTIEKAGLEFEIDAKDVGSDVYVDRDMWEKVILNLLSNAFKFTFDGKISVRVREKNNQVEIQVQDSGIGISEAELPRLFERFHRVHGAKSRTYEGTGIGLALVQELVTMHGGEITASSAPNKGTTFTILLKKGAAHLPEEKVNQDKLLQSSAIRASAYIQEAEMWSGTDSSQTTEGKDKPMVLVADDNTDMRNYVASILKEKWQVITAQHGEEALSLARNLRPDLILSDVMMPVLDGFGLLEKIRSDENLKHTPLVLLSARAGEEAKVEGLNAGADDYLVKPFSAKELTSRLDSILKNTSKRHAHNLQLALDAEKFRSTFNHASVNIAMLDLSGVIMEINDSFLKESGYKAEEVIGRHFSEITHPDDVISNGATIEKIKNGECYSASFEKRYIRKNGTFFWVKTSVSAATDAANRPMYLIAVSQDIDHIKSTELKYKKAVTNLEEEKDLREKFVATLTHDLRSPMTSAKLSAQLIQKRPDNSDSVQNQAARIVNSVAKADQMIQDLLDANRIRAGEKLPMKLTNFAIDHLIKDTVDNAITIHGDRFIFQSETSGVHGNWSASGISRILDNLINNAIKYGDPHANVTIFTRESSKNVEIHVHNEGNPISAEEQNTIFDIYKRSTSADRGKHKGWGLGLTLVKGVTNSMGGDLGLSSDAENGTIFKVCLPKNLTMENSSEE